MKNEERKKVTAIKKIFPAVPVSSLDSKSMQTTARNARYMAF
jgi:hypothetical protein